MCFASNFTDFILTHGNSETEVRSMQRVIAELEGKLDTYVSRYDSVQHLSRSVETEKSELLAAYRAAQQQLAVLLFIILRVPFSWLFVCRLLFFCCLRIVRIGGSAAVQHIAR